MDYSNVAFDKWAKAKEFLSRNFGEHWCFRGQADANWGLRTSLERHGLAVVNNLRRRKNVTLGTLDATNVELFQRAAHHYLPPEHHPKSQIEWLALMQHHGAPTRLLDWTYSPYIGAYFALEDATKTCAIWAIKHRELFKATLGLLIDGHGYKLPPKTKRHWDEDYLKAIDEVKPDGVCVVEPRHTNQRITVQQGLFLMPGNPDRTFEESLISFPHDLPSILYRIDLNPQMRSEALMDLERMNITRASIYPGLDGYAQSLKYRLHIEANEDLLDKWLDLDPPKP